MEMVTLKNGTEECLPLVVSTVETLKFMFDTAPVAFIEFVELCRDPNHKVWGSVLDEWESVVTWTGKDYSVHESIRNVVISAVSGNDENMHLVNPINGGKRQ